MGVFEGMAAITASEKAALIQQVIQDQQQLVLRLLSAAGTNWAHLDLPLGQLKALLMVDQNGPLPVGQLGATLGIGKPAATLLVNALVRRDLVVRSEDPEDRRRTLVQLSKRGQELMFELRLGRHGGESLLSGWLAQLDEDDIVALGRGLRALVAVVTAKQQAQSA